MDDMDEIIPELDARYDTRLGDDKTDTENHGAKDTSGKKFSIQISKAYPILKEFAHAGAGDAYLIEHNGLESILKFYSSDMVPSEEVIRKVKKLSERLHNFIMRIYEYGFDENTKRWYVIQGYAKHGSLKNFAELNNNLKILNLVIKEIIEGLNALHEDNILHLNLKPSNILMREKQPPHPAFTDFDIYSIIGSEHIKKISSLKDRPLYSSPELISGHVGREADYWSLGIIILELMIGKHPFGDLDERSIADILSTKGVSIPEHISEEYKILLRGLLTRETWKRWGYAEVKRWLEKDMDIPVHYSNVPEETGKEISKNRSIPYKFLNEEFFSLEEMIPSFLKSEEAWEAAKEHLRQGYISKWLAENSDKKANATVDNIREQSAGDPALALIILVYTFKNELPFIFHGKLINCDSLYSYAGRVLKKEAPKGEESIIDCLLNGKLIEYYREYMMLTSKEYDELLGLFEAVRKAVSRKEDYHEKLNALYKMLDIITNPLTYILPAKVSDNVMRNLDFIAGNIDVVITREKYNELYNEMNSNLIIPEEMREEINNTLSSGLSSEYLRGLEKFRDGSLLSRAEFNKLQDEYILPEWLESELLRKETFRYMAAIKLLRKLQGEGLFIKTNDFLDYVRKYYRFIGNVVEISGGVQRSQKGEALEQKWIRLLRYDINNEGYLKLAKHVKNNVMLSMISNVEAILKRLSTQIISSDSMNEIIKYVEALKSGEVKWDDADKQIVNEIHSLVFRKKNAAAQFFEKITEDARGKLLRTFIKIVLGIDADERTREMEFSLTGAVAGVLIGVIAWIIIASLEWEISFYGPVGLGFLLGLLRKSIPLALMCAAAGFAGAFFIEMETLIEVIYAFPIAIIGSAKIGAFLGRRINKFSFCDDILRKYNDRINDVMNAAEAVSH